MRRMITQLGHATGSRSPHSRSGRRRAFVAILALLIVATVGVGSPTPASSAVAARRTVGGELHCPAWARVSGIWMKGSQSGWHGGNYAYSGGRDTRPVAGRYSASFVVGEQVKTWIRCSLVGSRSYTETYSVWTVGSGSSRHICASGSGPVCVPGNVAGCVLYAALSSNPISIWRCALRL